MKGAMEPAALPAEPGRPRPPSQAALLEALLEAGPTSRSALAAALSLSRATLTEVSRDLIDQGLLLETADDTGPRRGKGRPSVRLELNAGYGYCLGASVTGSQLHLVLTDLLGSVHASQTRSTTDAPLDMAAAIAAGLQDLLQTAGIARRLLLGIGLALSGFVDRETGVCLHSANLGWYDVPIASLVSQATGLPTTLENDANAAAISEKLFGVAREARNFTLIALGPSIGGAHYIEGQLYRGTRGGAGELAHCTVDLDGLPCRCGKRGCLDTVASGTAMLQAARDAGLDVVTLSQLETLAIHGNARADQILRRASQALALVISHVIQSNDPELVLIADTSGFDQGLFLTRVRQGIENNILPRFLSTTRIEFHHVSDDFWARGAASLAAHRFFTSV